MAINFHIVLVSLGPLKHRCKQLNAAKNGAPATRSLSGTRSHGPVRFIARQANILRSPRANSTLDVLWFIDEGSWVYSAKSPLN
jgi:hypothetical protein